MGASSLVEAVDANDPPFSVFDKKGKHVNAFLSWDVDAPVLPVDLSSLALGSLEMEVALSHAFAAAASYAFPSRGSVKNAEKQEEGSSSDARCRSFRFPLVALVMKVQKSSLNFSSASPLCKKMDAAEKTHSGWGRHDTDVLYRTVDRCQQRIYPPLDPLQYLEYAPMMAEDIAEEDANTGGSWNYFSPPYSCRASSSWEQEHFHRLQEGHHHGSVSGTAGLVMIVFFIRPTFPQELHEWQGGEENEEDGDALASPWWPLLSRTHHQSVRESIPALSSMTVLNNGELQSKHHQLAPPCLRHTVEGVLPWFSVLAKKWDTMTVDPPSSFSTPLSSSSSSLEVNTSLLHSDGELWRLAKEASDAYKTQQSKRWGHVCACGDGVEKATNDMNQSNGSIHSYVSAPECSSAASSCGIRTKMEKYTEKTSSKWRKLGDVSMDTRNERTGGSHNGKKGNNGNREDGTDALVSSSLGTLMMETPLNGIVASECVPEKNFELHVSPPLNLALRVDYQIDAAERAQLAATSRRLFLFRWRVARWLAERWINEPHWCKRERTHALSSSYTWGGSPRREMRVAGRRPPPPLSPFSQHVSTPLSVLAGGPTRYANVCEAALAQPGRRCRHCDARGIECTVYWVGQTTRYAYLAVLANDTHKKGFQKDHSSSVPSPFSASAEDGDDGSSVAVMVVGRVPIPMLEHHVPHSTPREVSGMTSWSIPTGGTPEETIPRRKRYRQDSALSSTSLEVSLQGLEEVVGYDMHFVTFPFTQWRIVTIRAHGVVVVAHNASSALPSPPSSSSPSSFSGISAHTSHTMRCCLEDCFITSLTPPSSVRSSVPCNVIHFNDLLWLIKGSCTRYLITSTHYSSLLTLRESKKKGGKQLQSGEQPEKREVAEEGNGMASTPMYHTGAASKLAEVEDKLLPSTQEEYALCETKVEIVIHGLQLLEAMRDTCSVYFKKRRGEKEEGTEMRDRRGSYNESVEGGRTNSSRNKKGERLPVSHRRGGSLFARASSSSLSVASVSSAPSKTSIPFIRTYRDVPNVLEGPTVEFKYTLGDDQNPSTITATVDRLRHTIAAMASTMGGVVCIGVRDEDGAVVGHPAGQVKEKNGKRLLSGYCPAMVKDAVTLQELPVLFAAPHTTTAPRGSMSGDGSDKGEREQSESAPVDGGSTAVSFHGGAVALAKDWWKTGRMLRTTSSAPLSKEKAASDEYASPNSSLPTSSIVEERRMTVVRIQRGQAPFYAVAKDAIPYQRGCASTTPMSIWSIVHRILQQLRNE